MQAEKRIAKRKSKDNTQEGGATKKAKIDSAVSILSLDLIADSVTLLNSGLEEVDVSGWIIDSKVGDQSYEIPAGTVIGPGATLTVWSGAKNKGKDNPPNSFFWTAKYIWNNKGDSVVLKNADGDEVDDKEEKPEIEEEPAVAIHSLDLKRECAVIENQSNTDQDISGWFLNSVVGDQTFLFPENTILKAGQSIVIWSGPESDQKVGPFSFSWTRRYIWNDNGDTAALYNKAGNLVSKRVEFPNVTPSHVEPPTKTKG
eukprot:CAMPEP_0174252714 /NCGR_PEP_ID=MMETSP0439-20130205/2080_1 /TAXON_ID=0 /ORGANISM="Stereomyxa ramosa, Strain Chinc5" /LENGTH=257 /DNA_ID=CAMNT_0015333301 /DNA_START=28 /DNA_END=801 /DNA_ORIENTATION=-